MTAYQSHGILIPPRFSRSRPHCLIPRPRGAVTGQKYHYPPAFHCLTGSCPDFQVHISRSLFRGHGVWLAWLPRFHTGRRINVFRMLYIQFSSYLEECFIHALLLYRDWERRFVDVLFQNFFNFFQSRFNRTKNSHFINFFNCSNIFVGKSMNTM